MVFSRCIIDGKAVGNPFDCYNPNLNWSGPISLGQVNLEAGKHEIKLVAAGKNADSTGYSLGIDAIRFTSIGSEETVVEGEDLETRRITGGARVTQDMSYISKEWSGDKQLLWCWRSGTANQLSVGSEMELYLDIKEDFDGALRMFFTKAADFGIVQLYIDDQEIGQPANLYSASVVRSEAINFYGIKLNAGVMCLR